MIKTSNERLDNSTANFIVRMVDCQGNAKLDGHVEKEYLKFLKHHSKTNELIRGSVQYIPNDVWAIGMVDTIKNKDVIAYDDDYQYSVNLFGHDFNCGSKDNLKAIKYGLKDIFYKARKINATVAIPYGMGKENWNEIYNEIKYLSNDFNVDVELHKNK